MSYEFISVPTTYYKYGSGAPIIEDSYSFYIEKEPKSYSYRGVEVFVKETLNSDHTHRGYLITDISIKTFGKKLHTENVREFIDEAYNKLLNNLKDNPMKVDYKMESGNDYLYETAINRIINKRYNILEKRYILGDLISKGLKLHEAINFYQYI